MSIKIGRNRVANLGNPYQGSSKKVLCVCSAGLLRSPTLAWVLSNPPFNFNTRACGTSTEYALIPLEAGLVMWADEIVVMEEYQQQIVHALQHNIVEEFEHTYKPVRVFEVPDNFGFRHPTLVQLLTEKALETFGEVQKD